MVKDAQIFSFTQSTGSKALLLFCVSFVLLFLPSYWHLAQTVWVGDDEMHGPIVLAVAAWAMWKCRDGFAAQFSQGGSAFGLVICLLGVVIFVVGKLLQVLVLEIGSQLIVLGGAVIYLGGLRALKLAVFPLAFLLFMVPLPPNLIDSITGHLKEVVSIIAEQILYSAGYPIARSGVMITVGQYQLLVADACSGLKSMFSLSAIGLLYVYLIGHKNRVRNALLIAALLPIAFVANVIRVLVLMLVTYHYGDAAGQGFIHDFAGIFLFVLAVVALSVFDGLLEIFFRTKPHLKTAI